MTDHKDKKNKQKPPLNNKEGGEEPLTRKGFFSVLKKVSRPLKKQPPDSKKSKTSE